MPRNIASFLDSQRPYRRMNMEVRKSYPENICFHRNSAITQQIVSGYAAQHPRLTGRISWHRARCDPAERPPVSCDLISGLRLLWLPGFDCSPEGCFFRDHSRQILGFKPEWPCQLEAPTRQPEQPIRMCAFAEGSRDFSNLLKATPLVWKCS